MEKAKKEDFRVEEELRSQKVKYEEASDDVLRRMQDVKDSEAENVIDMGAFLDAQLEYHERSREALLQLKNEWPGYVRSFVAVHCTLPYANTLLGPARDKAPAVVLSVVVPTLFKAIKMERGHYRKR